MYYLQRRCYDPQVGRFINSDDIKYLNVDATTISQNLYCYCGNEPISRIDYFGSAWSIDSVLDKILTYAAKICEFILKKFNISDRKYKARNKYKNKKDLVNFVHENKSKIKKLGKTFNAINTFLQIVFTVIDCAKIIKNAKDEVKGIAEVLFEGFKTLIQFLAKKLISFIITSVIKFLALVKWLIERILDSIFDYILGTNAVSGFITNVKNNYLLNINSKDITFKMFILAFFKGVKAAV